MLLDYRVHPEPRRQNAAIRIMLDRNKASFESVLGELSRSIGAIRQARLPWTNPYLPPFDAISLYGLIASRRPGTYLEIGSGNSTIFARQAITDCSPASELASIDPHPRREIDAMCDVMLRSRLEDIDLDVFRNLRTGDVVFFDGSHGSFPNSDVTVFMLEALPTLARGIAVGIHDIYLPDDYPLDAAERMWNEQYLLATQLIAAGADHVLLPNYFVTHYTDFAHKTLAHHWREIGLSEFHGTAFWLET